MRYTRYTRSVLLLALLTLACDDQRPLEEPESEPLTYGSPCRTDVGLLDPEHCPSPLVCFAGRADWTRPFGYCTDPCKVDADCSGAWAYCEPDVGVDVDGPVGGCAEICHHAPGLPGDCSYPGGTELWCVEGICVP